MKRYSVIIKLPRPELEIKKLKKSGKQFYLDCYLVSKAIKMLSRVAVGTFVCRDKQLLRFDLNEDCINVVDDLDIYIEVSDCLDPLYNLDLVFPVLEM